MEWLAVGAIIIAIWLVCRLIMLANSSAHDKTPPTISSSSPTLSQPAAPSFVGTSGSLISQPTVSAATKLQSGARWLRQEETIEIHGVRITGGFLYVGNALDKVTGYGLEPALIDPRLPVESSGTGEDMPYWPSYRDISSAARGAYLRWLAGGRCDPSATLGLVFLFFYGLERRALAEKSQVSDIEWEQIRVEVERLFGIYGNNHSFHGYATGFLGILGAAIDCEKLTANPPSVTKSHESLNLSFRMGLGWMADNSRPVPSAWALAWVRSNDAFYGRTPATRCPAEFERLFAVRYREQFGEGVIVKPNKTRIKASYRPASASFGGAVDLQIPALPDVTVLKQPIEKLILLANQCVDELDPYSRYLGRNPDAGESIGAFTLLPQSLIEHGGHPTLERIRTWIADQSFINGLAVTTYPHVREVWNSLPAIEITKRDAVMFSQCLARLGYGAEPDIRFGSHQLRADSQIVLFALPADAPAAPSAPYTSSTLLAHLGAIVAHADDQVRPEEEQALMTQAAQALELSVAERLRLQAYMKWLLTTPPETTGLKRRIDLLPEDRRSQLGAFLARLVGVDGDIAPSEITALQKVYRQLGLDPKNVFTDTHSAATEPVWVQAGQPASGYSIPLASAGKGKPKVDLDRIRTMEAESEQVSILLRGIFASDDDVETIIATKVSDRTVPSAIRVLDLDEAHSRFTLSLIERASWTRIDLELMASRQGLMPDGAIDAINEAALNLHGEPLLEGDDPIEINQQLRSVVQQ